MHIRVGTSGYSYKEWKGTFYPDDLPAAKMLPYYGERFDSVEINNTFYRMPDAKMVAKWGEQVPDGFTFVLKAPQRITHQKRLVGAGDDLRQLFEAGEVLGSKLGPVLFQLPPFSRKDALKLREFVAILPPDRRVAFEFRHDSWFDDEIYGILRERDIALCAADTDEVTDPGALVVPTASWGYMRLRRTEYAPGELTAWAERVEKQAWSDAYVFFKHEDEGKGPRFAVEFRAQLH
ncbi:MAG TPA: DUF72 domain-containing protein [Thermoanaerobaculia bacterium]|jgi:uncharacterized protein YecE (DUF72 family)|nr:DUF72 domain-containing protein [Thermoanaerobaculia bacterium]